MESLISYNSPYLLVNTRIIATESVPRVQATVIVVIMESFIFEYFWVGFLIFVFLFTEAWNAHPTCSLHAKTLNNDVRILYFQFLIF